MLHIRIPRLEPLQLEGLALPAKISLNVDWEAPPTAPDNVARLVDGQSRRMDNETEQPLDGDLAVGVGNNLNHLVRSGGGRTDTPYVCSPLRHHHRPFDRLQGLGIDHGAGYRPVIATPGKDEAA